jgi:hypothetical protein
MNGNNPYAGPPGVTNAGEPAPVDLSPKQEQRLRRTVAGIVSRTESYLPDSYAVGSELSIGTEGPQATVAVNPPAGHPSRRAFRRISRSLTPASPTPTPTRSPADWPPAPRCR